MIDERLKELLAEAGFDSATAERLPGAGSDREFHRIHRSEKSAILMTGAGHGAAIDDWVEIQRYLLHLGFCVPELFAANLEIPAALVEDLGGFTAPSLREYPTIVRELARLAVIGGERIADCPVVANRCFDFEAFRWESTYFAERYLRDYRRIEREIIETFAPSFDAIATELASLPKYFTHRDFQSTNVSVIDGRVRIIDFQSARHGPAHYDLASLLWDPYVEIPADARRSLIEIYMDEFERLTGKIDREDFEHTLLLAAKSRLMQALGAFCFLSDVKGKTAFRKYIPNAERLFNGLLDIGLVLEL